MKALFPTLSLCSLCAAMGLTLSLTAASANIEFKKEAAPAGVHVKPTKAKQPQVPGRKKAKPARKHRSASQVRKAGHFVI